MTANVRDTRSGASVHPQYNILNVMYTMYVQIFENIEKRQFPAHVRIYIERNGITPERIHAQQQIIAELLDGLLSGTFERKADEPYVITAMRHCDWENRVDWDAMSVFDMLASRALLGYWFNAAADLFNEEDVRAQSPGQLTAIIKRICEKAIQTGGTLDG